MTETQGIPCGRNPGATQPSPAHDPARASPVGPSPRMAAAPCPSRTCSARAVPCDVFSSPCAVTRASRAFSQSRLVFSLYSDEWRLEV